MRRLRIRPLGAVCAGVLVVSVLAGSAWAKNITGSARNDVLRGTAKADRISGLGGNDKLSGLGGNDVLLGGAGKDVLVGGAGADSLNCGAGVDIAIADARDTVSPSCETVRGLPVPPPPGPTAKPGHYCGFTNNGFGFCFDITPDGKSFTNAVWQIITDCTPQSRFKITFSTTGLAPLQPDLAFDYPSTTGSFAGSYVRGKLDTIGTAAGVVHIVSNFDFQGTNYNCLFDTEWTAKLST